MFTYILQTRKTGNIKLASCLIVTMLIFSPVKAQVIYNAYGMVTGITNGTLLTVSNVSETNHTLTANEQVIVMQMQDDVIGTNTANTSSFGDIGGIANAGRFEVDIISAVNRSGGTATSVALSSSLVNTYNTGANSRVQIISLTKLSTSAFTTTNSITGAAWNGSIGGVVAVEVGTDFTISHSITASGLGFRGGTVSGNFYSGGTVCTTFDYATSSTVCGHKGEGIFAATSSTQTNGIARIANGGGGGGRDHNAGGGGGGNYTTGGAGGMGWNGTSTGCTGTTVGSGLGGVTLSVNINASRVFMGGGGGGGQQNDAIGTNGGNGGGIILIKANRILTGGCAFSPSIVAHGQAAANTSGGDGAGGGGAGGSIVIQTSSFSATGGCPLTIAADGGNGGNSTTGTFVVSVGGGGAGSQGAVIFSTSQPTTNVVTHVNNGTEGCSQTDCSTKGSPASGSNNSGIKINSTGVLPIELLYFVAENQQNEVYLNWATASEKNTSHFLVKRSIDGQNWSVLDKVDASGFSKTTQFYNSIDYNPPKGNVYYLITTVDADQSEQNSPIQLIERNTEDALMVLYPNPAYTNLNVALSHNEQNAIIEIYDATGAQKPVDIIERLDKRIILDVSGFTKGVYFVRCLSENNSILLKLIIN